MTQAVSTRRFEASIPYSEWEQVNRLKCAVGDDERRPIGRIHLSCDGTRRVWRASDSFCALQYVGGTDTGVYAVSLPPRISSFAWIAAVKDGETTLSETESEEGGRTIVLTGSGGTTTYDSLVGDPPPMETLFNRRVGVAEATVDIQDFRFLWSLIGLHRHQPAQRHPLPEEETHSIPVMLMIHDGFVAVERLHEELGSVMSSTPAQTSGVPTRRLISHDNLKAALDGIEMLVAFGSQAAGIEGPFFVDIVMPEDEDSPVQFFGRDTAAVVMPRVSPALKARNHVEEVITDAFGSVSAERDEDGDYPLLRHRVPVYGRLVTTGDEVWLQVFTVLLSKVECTAELLKELNDLNQHLSYAPVFHVGSEDGPGQVVSKIDLLADTLDPEEVSAAVKRIHEMALSITPTLAAVFGGQAVKDPAEIRWSAYRETVIQAELVPDVLTALTGNDGVEPWPFPGPVHVITGWNPQGVSLGDELHQRRNQEIAKRVVDRGGRYLVGVGHSADAAHVEPSIIAWQLSRSEALEIGRLAYQDAIFEVDAEELHLLSCHGDRQETWPRRAS